MHRMKEQAKKFIFSVSEMQDKAGISDSTSMTRTEKQNYQTIQVTEYVFISAMLREIPQEMHLLQIPQANL